MLIAGSAFAQQQEFKEIGLGDNSHYLCSIDLAPNGKELAIATAGGNILFWDIASQQVTRKLAFDQFKVGPYMWYSRDGQYLLLLEQFFTDWQLNTDRPSLAAVVDLASGELVLQKEGVHAASFTPDSQSLITLQGKEIIFWTIATGKAYKRFSPPNVSNSFGISMDGTTLAVAQRPTEDDLKNIPSVRNDKKAIKEALKYREVVVYYDANTLQRKSMADDIMDIVFSMRYTADGTALFLFNAPNTRLREVAGSNRNAYLQVVDASSGKVSRITFATNAPEPIYKENANGMYVGITSVEHQRTVANSLLIFERQTGQLLWRFKNDFRLLENNQLGRACFEFLPDDTTIALGYGTKLVLWNFSR